MHNKDIFFSALVKTAQAKELEKKAIGFGPMVVKNKAIRKTLGSVAGSVIGAAVGGPFAPVTGALGGALGSMIS